MQSGETHMEMKALRRLGWSITAIASEYLVSCNRSSLTKSSDAREDLVRVFGPSEWLGGFVAGGEVKTDGILELGGAFVVPRRSCLSVRSANQRST